MAKIKAFSPEFASALKDEINKSAVYKQAGKGWKWTVGLVVEAEPDKNFPEAKGVFMDLFEGEARAIEVVSDSEAGKADFVITAPYSRWKQVMQKELDPTKGMMQGKLKLKGDLPTIVRYVKAANELVNLAGSVPTEFVDEKVGA